MKGIFNVFILLVSIGFFLSSCGSDTTEVAVVEQPKVEEENFPRKVINPIPTADISEAVAKTPVSEKIEEKTIAKAEVVEAIKKVAEKKPAVKKKPVKKKKARIKFDTEVFNFGTIKPGEVINHKFEFTNTGDADLVIKGADVTCGCTHPSYPFIPIAPGERGFIGVNYDSKGKLGKQKPTVTLTTNAGTKKISLEGYVFTEMAKE